MRLGYDILDNVGPPTIRPASPGGDYFPRRSLQDPFGAYAFAGVGSRAVLYNATLDGNLLSESPSVDEETLVHDLSLGVAVEFLDLRFSFARVFRTEEFEDQENTGFGAITAGVNLDLKF